MERTFITYESLIATLCEAQGFTPHLLPRTDAKPRLATSVAAIVRPSSIVEREGSVSGRIKHKIDFSMLQCALYFDSEDRKNILEEMRIAAIEVVNKLAKESGAIIVDALKIEPHEQRLTMYDEVAMRVTAEVMSNYNIT